MISCTEFIPAYSEGFKFLEAAGGYTEVEKFWAYLSDLYLKDSLVKHVKDMGIAGCFEYWKHSLSEEAADFIMTLDEENGEFKIDMIRCPSKGMLIEMKNMEPYESYCNHCPALYSRVLEPMGYEFIMDLTDTDKAKCSVVIRKKQENERSK